MRHRRKTKGGTDHRAGAFEYFGLKKSHLKIKGYYATTLLPLAIKHYALTVLTHAIAYIPQNTHSLYLHFTLPPSFLCLWYREGGPRALRRAKRKGRAGADLLLGVPVADKRETFLQLSYRRIFCPIITLYIPLTYPLLVLVSVS